MIRRFFLSLSENGFLWTIYYLFRRYFLKFANFFESRMGKIENKKSIAGCNSIRQNVEFWDNYNWKNSGEEWTQSKEWKEKFVKKIIDENIKPNSMILEVGPGAGRWTQYLIDLSRKLILVDVSQKCLDVCRNKFNSVKYIEYKLLEEINIDFLENNSIDYIFSYGVFIHLDKRDITKYFSEFKKKLSRDGLIFFHYNKAGDKYGNFISRFNEEDFQKLLREHDLEIKKEFDIETMNVIENNFSTKSINQSISILMKGNAVKPS